MLLRDGSSTDDPRLDRLIQFDERSRAYPVRALVEGRLPRSYSWNVPTNLYPSPFVLDQGREGACVGFGAGGELASRPKPISHVSNETARAIYKAAQRIDPWEGEDYEGTSVLAGVQVLEQQGYIDEYRWAFSIDDLILALGYQGPALLGVPWYSGMYDAPGGKVTVSGSVVGGHCILAYGVSLKRRTVRWLNSWGPTYGVNGRAEISFDDLSRLLNEQGEACVPVVRSKAN